jgi:hypothetical protein
MTITYPNRARQANFALRVLGLGILLAALVSVYLYNQTVTLRHSVSYLGDSVNTLQVKNADLKNSIFSLLDSKNLVSLAGKLGLVKEATPSYLRLGTASAAEQKQAAFEYR